MTVGNLGTGVFVPGGLGVHFEAFITSMPGGSAWLTENRVSYDSARYRADWRPAHRLPCSKGGH